MKCLLDSGLVVGPHELRWVPGPRRRRASVGMRACVLGCVRTGYVCVLICLALLGCLALHLFATVYGVLVGAGWLCCCSVTALGTSADSQTGVGVLGQVLGQGSVCLSLRVTTTKKKC